MLLNKFNVRETCFLRDFFFSNFYSCWNIFLPAIPLHRHHLCFLYLPKFVRKLNGNRFLYAISFVWTKFADAKKNRIFVTYSVAFTSIHTSLAWHPYVARSTWIELKVIRFSRRVERFIFLIWQKLTGWSWWSNYLQRNWVHLNCR